MIYTDQIMREVRIANPPSRIISLVPSLTELLCDLGLENELVGITKFCIHPQHIFRSKTHIGGTKKIDIDKIISLNPDLIIANKEENTKSDIELLEKKIPVWVSDVNTLNDALEMIGCIGQITGKQNQAALLNKKIAENFSTIQPVTNIKTLYLIWKDPYMAAGENTFINEMMSLCGMDNVMANVSRYPELTEEKISSLQPELVLLSSEPYPFGEKHLTELKTLLPHSKIMLVDGSYFSWYGSRLADAPSYFNEITAELIATYR